MIIVWSRFGILVPLFVIASFVGSTSVVGLFHLAPQAAGAAAVLTASVLSALAVYFTANALEAKDPRVLIDAATNRRIVVRPSAGHFFFVPMRLWPYVIVVLGVLVVVLQWTGQVKDLI
jgi:hypothetical protein